VTALVVEAAVDELQISEADCLSRGELDAEQVDIVSCDIEFR
jgi:hypothetical protein